MRKSILIMLVVLFSQCFSALLGEEMPSAPLPTPKNPFNRNTAMPPPLHATDWHCAECQESQFARAGNPQCVRPLAHESNTSHYSGWWVGGGGKVFGGDAPQHHEGTWGWDYLGRWNRKVVFLDWNHGQRIQAGTGAYKTDGPKLRHE